MRKTIEKRRKLFSFSFHFYNNLSVKSISSRYLKLYLTINVQKVPSIKNVNCTRMQLKANKFCQFPEKENEVRFFNMIPLQLLGQTEVIF